MHRFAIGLVLASLLVAAQAASFSFSGNVSLTDREQSTMAYRSVNTGSLDIIGVFRTWFKSVSVSNTGFNGINGDLLWGEMWGGFGQLPVCYLTYYNASASITPNATIDFSSSGAFIGQTFLSVQELDVNGNVVSNLPLTGALLNIGNLYWTKKEAASNDGLTWLSLSGKESDRNYEIVITYFISDKVGVINKANTVITPRVIESIVEINNWPYANSANSLRLTTAVASAVGTFDSNANLLALGEGINKVFAAVSGKVEVSGTSHEVQISAQANVDLSSFGSAIQTLVTAVNGKYGSNAQFSLFNITFPAGAANIVYDPTIGHGDPITASYSAAASVVVATTLMALLTFVALLF